MPEFIRFGGVLYGVSGCVACLIHMWRNRKERDTVKAYAYILVLEFMIALMYGKGWDIE